MMKKINMSNSFFKIINKSLMDLPSPSSISYLWNGGFMLGLCLVIQILSGIMISMHYYSNLMDSFNSIIHIMREVNWGWIMRTIHANGASLFFIIIYFHISRGMYFKSYKFFMTWLTGVLIFLVLMMTAFLGYVLPWGQMSFWGATVITNLISAIPYLGNMIVQWLWGGFSVSGPTLSRFFSLHFLLPFLLVFFILLHLLFLHDSGSNSPLGLNNNMDKIFFHSYFLMKDIMGLFIMIILFMMLNLLFPFSLGDPDNFIPANPMSTPPHIQPEWYFLFAYAILRSIPNKLGGVVALLMSIMIIMILSIFKQNKKSNKFLPFNKMMFWTFCSIFLILTWIGKNPVEDPFILIGQIFSFLYFIILILMSYI